MTKKKVGTLAVAAVLVMGVLVVADKILRTNTVWIGREQKTTGTAQPFLSNWVFPAPYQAQLSAKETADLAEKIESQPKRAVLLLQAVDLLKDKDQAELRMYYLRRICEECPDAPQSAKAWSRQIQEKLARQPPQHPGRDVGGLVGVILRFGVGEGEENISPETVKKTIEALQKSFPAEAKTLQSALDAATAKPESAK
ncbi:MAG: hypothetical protein JW849_01495 [Phycisphaerae bacterium]|nr:hypothetical protein [Phycisphaerae bacterium]